MDGQAVIIFNYIIITVLNMGIDLFGIVTNIINVICFIKQGFKDSITVSLFGLAVTDLSSLIALVMVNIWLTPAVSTADLSFEAFGMYYLTAGYPYFTFTRVTSWITAIITMERALCVIAPLEVNRIFTSKRMSVILVCVIVALIASMAPVYVVNKLEMKSIAGRNRTIFGLVFTADREEVEKMSLIFNNFLTPFVAFAVITICTVILVTCLKRRSGWLQTVAKSANSEIFVRNQRVAKMVVMISTLFIACFVPFAIMSLFVAFDPRFSVGGEYINLCIVFGGIGFLLQSINSSANIFIYYRMSSKYRYTFHLIFTCYGKGMRVS